MRITALVTSSKPAQAKDGRPCEGSRLDQVALEEPWPPSFTLEELGLSQSELTITSRSDRQPQGRLLVAWSVARAVAKPGRAMPCVTRHVSGRFVRALGMSVRAYAPWVAVSRSACIRSTVKPRQSSYRGSGERTLAQAVALYSGAEDGEGSGAVDPRSSNARTRDPPRRVTPSPTSRMWRPPRSSSSSSAAVAEERKI